MARVLLVDTGFSAWPILQHMTLAGHEVTLVGGRPDDALARLGHARIDLDYRDADALAEVAARVQADRLVPGCNDVSLAVCADVASVLDIPGHDDPSTIRTLIDKRDFRQRCAAVGVAAPRLLSRAQATGRAVVVKPARGYSGHGVTLLPRATPADLDAATALAESHCARGQHLIEEHFDGSLYSHSAFVVAGRIAIDFWVREEGTADPRAVDVSRVASPAPAAAAAVRRDVEAIVRDMALADGLLHTQVLINRTDHALVEVTRRCPGDLYSGLIERSTAYPYTAAYCASFLDDRIPQRITLAEGAVLRVTVSPESETTLGSIEWPAGMGRMTMVPLARAGDDLGPGPEGRAAILFIEFEDTAAADSAFEAACQRRLHTIRPTPVAEAASDS